MSAPWGRGLAVDLFTSVFPTPRRVCPQINTCLVNDCREAVDYQSHVTNKETEIHTFLPSAHLASNSNNNDEDNIIH